MTSHKWPISQTVLYLKLQHGGSHSNIHIEVNFVVISRHYFILEKLPKRRSRRVPWTDSEKKAVKAELGHFITKLMVPGKLDCDKCLKKKKRTFQENLEGYQKLCSQYHTNCEEKI